MKTTLPVIHKLFHLLRNMYGGSFVDLIGNDIPEAKQQWLKACKGLSAEAIGKALDKVKERYPNKPPDMVTFVKFVKEVKATRPGHFSGVSWKTPHMDKCSKKIGNNAVDNLKRNGYIF